MPTMKDVARLAMVSTATVSRVLREESYGTPDTRARVLDAVSKLRYQTNLLARNLRQSQTNFVIVVLPDITNPFFSKIVRGMEDVAHSLGYSVLLCNTDNDPAREADYIRLLQSRGADGIIFLTARTDSAAILQLAENTPVVLACEYIRGLPVPSVSIDNRTAAFTATQHLLAQGHTRIGMINGPASIILCHDRLSGYRFALEQAGLPFRAELVKEGNFRIDSGFALMEELLQAETPPSAVFCANDEMAMGAIQAVRAAGLTVPGDVAVVGFDDITFASVVEPPLTTIAQPTYEIGATAMRLLLGQIRGEKLVDSQVVLPHTLVIRRSSGVPG